MCFGSELIQRRIDADRQQGIADRLAAAEKGTGFRLGERVVVVGSSRNGTVAGFARLSPVEDGRIQHLPPGEEPERVVLVALDPTPTWTSGFLQAMRPAARQLGHHLDIAVYSPHAIQGIE